MSGDIIKTKAKVLAISNLQKMSSSMNQLMFEPLFSKSNHILSYQQLRAGLDYKNQFQFGFGCNLEQVGSNFQFFSNFGFFIRKDL
jgi:hypothetical protein